MPEMRGRAEGHAWSGWERVEGEKEVREGAEAKESKDGVKGRGNR